MVGDVTDAKSVLELAAGHDAIISTATQYNPGSDSDAFYTESSRALLGAARQTNENRVLIASTMAILKDNKGTLLGDAHIFPVETRPFVRSHALGLEILSSEGEDVDWLCISPSGNFTIGGRSGRYRVADYGSWTDHSTHADLAVAIVDEIEKPTHHRIHLAVRN